MREYTDQKISEYQQFYAAIFYIYIKVSDILTKIQMSEAVVWKCSGRELFCQILQNS